jgi:hypothetical protein
VKKVVPVVGLLLGLVIILVWRYQSQQSVDNEFSIVLTEGNEVLLTDDDILHYNSTSYTLILSTKAVNRLKNRDQPIFGDFTIIIKGESDLQGVFVPSIVSRTYPSTTIVIVYPSIESEYSLMRLQMGYPWDQPSDHDPRKGTKMTQYFKENGKIVN